MLNYLQFILENKEEFNLYYSTKFRSILKKIKDNGDKIAEILLQVEDNYMYKSKFTLIDVTDKNDTISFIQSNRIIRKNPDLEPDWISGGILPSYIKIDKNKSDEWKSGRTEMIIGRWTRKLFTDVLYKSRKSMVLNDSELEKFVNQYKATYDYINNIKLEIVEGEDIRHWYSEKNYYNRRGQLGSSCMRQSSKSTFFDIYVKNPEVCKLLILKSEDDNTKIKGRALLWKLNDGRYYQDRVYTNNESDRSLFENWAIERDMLYYSNYSNYMMVQLGNHEYEKYPYMDTFVTYNPVTKQLKNDEDLWPGQGYYLLQDTTGGFRKDDVVWSEYEQEYIDRENAVLTVNNDWIRRSSAIYVESRDEWYSPDDNHVVWSDWAEKNFHIDDVVYSQLMNDWLPIYNEKVIEIIVDDEPGYVTIDRYDLYFKYNDELYSRSYWIIDPFSGELVNKLRPSVENVYKRYDQLLISKLNSEIPSDKEAIDMLVNLYKSGKYDKEKVKSEIENNYYFKNKINGVYWGLSKEHKPTIDDMIVILFAGIHCNGFTIMKNNIDKYSDGYSERWSIWNRYDSRLTGLMFKFINSFDYTILGNDIYKIWVYFNI